jgi:hypothetical protein
VTQRFAHNGSGGLQFAFTSEAGFRLMGRLAKATETPTRAPAVVAIRGSEGLADRVPGPWARITIDPRGTGDTAWPEELSWHVRRSAAWSGRTVASMQVWDVLRGLKAVRTLGEVQADRLVLAASADMAAVALYAALLDGRLSALLLESPPATQNAPSRKDGKGPAIEMLNCLRLTDLAQVAGLLWPTEVVITGDCPDTYRWAQELYERLGKPGRFRVMPDLAEWRAE